MHVRSVVYQRHAKRLHCLRKLLYIKRQGKIPDPEVLKKAGVQSMHSVLKLAQLRWSGHVMRMPDERLPKTWATSKDMGDFQRQSS